MSVKKLMYVIFFSTQGPPIQIAVPKSRGVTGKSYRDKVLKILNDTTVNASQRVELRMSDFSTTTHLHTKQVL